MNKLKRFVVGLDDYTMAGHCQYSILSRARVITVEAYDTAHVWGILASRGVTIGSASIRYAEEIA